MKVLMISGDELVLNTSSSVAKRVIEYGKTFGELDIALLIYPKLGDTELSPETRVFVTHGKFLRFVRGWLRARKLMKIKKYDTITAQDTERSFIAWLLSKEFGVPWQMQIHTDILSPYFSKHSFFDWLRVKLVKFLIPRADGMRVVSQRIKDSILRTIDYGLSTKITVLPIFLDIIKVRNTPVKIDVHEKYGRDKFIILMPTRLNKEKNIGMALEAMKKLMKNNLSSLLLIIGDGPEKENLKLRTMNYGLSTNNVVFEDSVNFETLISYYKTADVYLLTSVYEGGARAPREALAAGLPVIMTDVAPANEDIIHEQNGLVIQVGDSAELARQLERLMIDPEFLARIKKGAEASFPNPKTKEDYLVRYKFLLQNLN
ncbi:MAG TPA: glycosyltransferase family 4 protein [Candidatus Paceibacterota bacterium]